MTTNSLEQINIQLNKIEKKDENIRITRSLGSTIEFLDVLVENNNGQLRTSVFHKPAADHTFYHFYRITHVIFIVVLSKDD
jgi:hypothetical protein